MPTLDSSDPRCNFANRRSTSTNAMNYFTHALNHLEFPYFAAGTGLPDWLGVADRRARLRPRLLEPWLKQAQGDEYQIAAGALQHLNDDDWFHCTRGFVEVTNELTNRFRDFLGRNEDYHCGFLGHVGMELLLDGVLIERCPTHFEDYWKCLQSIDPLLIEATVNQISKTPTDRLARLINFFRSEQFMRGYTDDRTLLLLLNQVMMRVKLTPIPMEAVEVVKDGRVLVRERIRDLLPIDQYNLP